MEKDTFKLTPQSIKDIALLKRESIKLVGKVLTLNANQELKVIDYQVVIFF